MGFRKDYHAGRSYAADPANDETGLAAWFMSKLRSIYRPSAPVLDVKLPSVGQDNSPFTRLGANDQDSFSRQSGRPVFPMADWTARPRTSFRHPGSAPSDATATDR